MSDPHPPPPAAAAGDAPPTYVPSQPQILVAPLPDSPSFFWGRTVQGEVFVKGLGDKKGNRGVKRLIAKLELTNSLPDHPTVVLHKFDDLSLYPPVNTLAESTSSPPSYGDAQFSTSHRFSFPLPPSLSTNSHLPGTLNLSASRRGEIKYTLVIQLVLSTGTTVEEVVPVEGTPQDVSVGHDGGEEKEETEEILERDGVKTRFVLETNTPRLGDLVRLGVEVRPMERQKTGVAGLSAQPNPTDTLRPLRRVRVELFRRVKIVANQIPSSSNSNSNSQSPEHLTLMFTSGKSLRYPGTSRTRPPLRVMFTLPTAQSGTVAGDTYGEITSTSPYHETTFFVRVTIGFGGNPELMNLNQAGPSTSTSTSEVRDWYIEQQLTIRPKLWVEPRQVIIHGGHLPASGLGADIGLDMEELDEATRAAYRAKGLDIVGDQGTYRAPDGESGPSGPSSQPAPAVPSPGEGGLPSFIESQAQMQAGETPVADAVQSERLVPVQFEDDSSGDRANEVGRRSSLGGELGTWVEYDGYETFSMAPPPAAVSYGVDSSMDPPQEGDEDVNVMGGMVARLGLGEGGVVRPGAQAELMEQLGLGEGTRVVDLQDDLPPGIDEPSLPGLPTSYTPHPRPHAGATPPTQGDTDNPPSFAASEAAQAVGGVASAQRTRSAILQQPSPVAGGVVGEAPPGYFGAPVVSGEGPVGGLPPYSQG